MSFFDSEYGGLDLGDPTEFGGHELGAGWDVTPGYDANDLLGNGGNDNSSSSGGYDYVFDPTIMQVVKVPIPYVAPPVSRQKPTTTPKVTTTPKTTTTANVEKALDNFFNDIEQDEDWIKEGAFSESSSGLKDYLNPLSGDKKPTYQEYQQRKEALSKKVSGLSDKELSGLAYASALLDNKIQGTLTKGALTGSVVTQGLSLLNSALNQGKYFDAAKEALGLTDEEMTNINGAWDSVRADSLKNGNSGDNDGFDYNEHYSNYNPSTQSVVLGQVVDNPETPVEVPAGMPSEFKAGFEKYGAGSNQITNDYMARADQLWGDYLAFENEFFSEFTDIKDQYNQNISSIPELNVTVPDTMGGATLPMAPKVHSAMYTDQANTLGNLTMNKANTQLAGMGSRDALNKNMFNVGHINIEDNLLPTKSGLDLYKLERAGQLGLDRVEAGLPDDPSTLETWAPVVGTLLTPNDSGQTALSSAWDFVTGLFK